MKKILLMFLVFFLTGCYDYTEINDLSFVSAIGIDYEDEEFKLTFELLNDTKKGESSSSQEGYTISGSGSSISKAFENISLKIPKTPYFYHLKAMIISEDVAKDHMKEITEYIIRNPKIRNEFYLVIAKDVSAKEIVKNTDKNNPIVGNQITKLIDSNRDGYSVTFAKPFEDILEKFANGKISPIVSVLTLSNENIKAVGLGIFDNYKYKYSLTALQSSYLNLLLNEPSNFLISKKYNDKVLAVELSDGNVKYTFSKDQILIDINIDGEIVENMPEFDLRKNETYGKLEDDFAKILEKDITELINIFVKENTDAIGLEKLYYKKYRKTNENILNTYDITVNTNVKLNKKGLIYEVNYE